MARGRPLTGALLGIVIGLAVAVVLQQQGIWPLDKITVFLLPGATGAIGILITTIGRPRATGTMIIALIIVVPLAAWGATGLGTINENGVLNGGCMVTAQSSAPDATNVTDSSKQDPFLISPQGSLQWLATSPSAFDDYPWKIWVEIGGVQITLDSEESEDNDGGSQINGDEVANVEAYAAERGIDISQLRGVYKVGGDAANTCDGFGFVKLVATTLETLAAKIAAGLAVILTIILIVISLSGRRRPSLPNGDFGLPNGDVDGPGGAGLGGAPIVGDTDGDGDDDIFTDGFESGDTSSWSDEP